jgi:hypothetical protein
MKGLYYFLLFSGIGIIFIDASGKMSIEGMEYFPPYNGSFLTYTAILLGTNTFFLIGLCLILFSRHKLMKMKE